MKKTTKVILIALALGLVLSIAGTYLMVESMF